MQHLINRRIRLINMPNDPDPIPSGSEGTVVSVTNMGWIERGQWQLDVKWNNGRTLSLVIPPDTFEVLE